VADQHGQALLGDLIAVSKLEVLNISASNKGGKEGIVSHGSDFEGKRNQIRKMRQNLRDHGTVIYVRGL
jgi:hypothetical protein